jgi:hypothetical protein
VLRREKFYTAPAKCSFMIDSVLFLGYVLSKDGLAVDESKVAAVRDWPLPTTLQRFATSSFIVPLHVPVGPITRARSKMIKEAISRLI